MTDTQYDYIKENLPKWAEKIEEVTRLMEGKRANESESALYLNGYLWGLSVGASILGMLSEADEFTLETIKRIKEEQER